MNQTTLLHQILEANQSFLKGRPAPLDPGGPPFVVVACMDARLTTLLESAMGLPRDRAMVVRIAGNRISPENRGVVRSIAAALYVKKATEVILVGHTDCAMSRFSAAEVAENFRRAGIRRSVFGDEDLRTWFGAFAGVEENVTESLAALHRLGILGTGMKAHGLVVDTVTGALKVLVDGDVAPSPIPEAAPAGELEFAVDTEGEEEEEAMPAAPPLPPVRERGAVVIDGAHPDAAKAGDRAAPMTYVDAVIQLRNMISAARQDPKLRERLSRLHTAARTERDPLRVYSELQRLEKECMGRYPELRSCLGVLREAIQSKKGGLNFIEMMRRIME
ncbi:MAG: carbonic anhydrase [Acidobacteriota bacterium]